MVRHVWFMLLLAALVLAGCAPAAPEQVTLRLGLLPIVDALPMYVAQQEGYFEKEGVAVEFVPVASAAERDQLMQAGQIDGMINDLVSTMFYNKDGRQIVIVRYARTATSEFPTYRLLASKDSGIAAVGDLKDVPIGISEGTVIAYTTDRLLQAEGIAPEQIQTIAVPKIPDRLALLESGELKAANLPDPLASLALLSGARVILDDTTHPEYGNSVISFRATVTEDHPDAIRAFLRAVEQGVRAIQADKTAWSSIMSENNLVPPPLLESYVVPDFPAAAVPTESQFADALAWTHEKGLVSADVSYAESVDAGFLPAP